MPKSVVLAEKPSVGKDLAKALGCSRGNGGYYEGNKYIVTWALGHLVTLADPEDYDPKYKTWRLEDLPMLPPKLKLEIIKKTAKQFNTVKAQLARQDVTEIIIATDAGREGELVAGWILKKAQVNKPVKRLWISSVTDKAIKEGFSKLKPGQDYKNLYNAAEARAEADWLVGINATRALTVKHNAQLSCGRVQTPTVAIIAQREDEIRNFKPKPFYSIIAATDKLNLIWQDKNRQTRTFDLEAAQKILKSLAGKNVQIQDLEKTPKKTFSPPLYDLTALQQEANKKFGYSPKETLSILQSLYETHKVLTYPRTDSRYLSSDIVGTIKERLDSLKTGQYGGTALKLLKNPIRPGGHFVNDAKVTDHHAIIPTEQFVPLSAFSDRERKIYDLVIKRFLAVLSPPFEYEETIVKAKIADENFLTKGKIIINAGWKALYSETTDDEPEEQPDGELEDQALFETKLPNLNKGDILPLKNINLKEGQTKPPPRFTEGSLIGAMENPVKYIGDNAASQVLKKTLAETGGLGTVATRADIIEKLFNSFLIEKKGKEIYVTSKGRQLLDLVPPDLKSPSLTGQWEMKLGAIAKGGLTKDDFIREMRSYAQKVVSMIKESQAKFSHDNMTRDKCPECGKYMLKVNSKRGQMLVCQDRECGFRKNTSLITNARCPKCHKKLELKGEGQARTFACACGHREKLTAFEARKKDEGNTASKSDVYKYLKETRKNEPAPLNNALAEALMKLKK